MQLLLQTIEEGFPADTPQEIREYHTHRSHLYSTDGVVVYKDRVSDSQGRLPESPTRGSSRCHNDAIQGRSIHILARHSRRHFTPCTGQPAASVTRCRHNNHHYLLHPRFYPQGRSRAFCRLFSQTCGSILQLAHCRTLVQWGYWPCRELAIYIRNLRHSRRYHDRRGS